MKKIFIQATILFLLFLISGCASTYKAINPPQLYYTAHSSRDSILISYKYNVLQEKGNKKFAKKEQRKGIQIIAIKLTNKTDRTVNVRKNIVFYSGDTPIYPMAPVDIKNKIRQSVLSYLPYLLLTFTTVVVSDNYSAVSYPVGIVIGPGITAANMAVAATANKKLLRELNDYNILDRNIDPGETVYGIIGVRNTDYGPITVRLKN